MASCAHCNTTILFGGKKNGDLRFCNAKCEQNGQIHMAAAQLPPQTIDRYVGEVHRGNCPRCQGQGPVDVHTSYRVWSALVVTTSSSHPLLSCKPCGTKRKLGDTAFSLVLGWWGFPWGLLKTPWQVGRNLVGIFQGPDPAVPSPQLEQWVRLQLATQVMARPQAADTPR